MTDALRCHAVSVAYGDVRALVDLEITVAAGETLALLGPSGSGKSTLCHAIAGFLSLSAGVIELSGVTVSTPQRMTPSEDRAVGLVFQSYALWPHMTARETVAYPLLRSGRSRVSAMEHAGKLLEMVGVGDLAERKPAELSGGQQQRVGLARALARDADLYLFDEPTAHLDAPIRAAVQQEIARSRAVTGAAAIYATHDAHEALAIADRIAVLRQGAITQVGSPVEIYERPADVWTARLSGPVSSLRSQVISATNGTVLVDVGGCSVQVDARHIVTARVVDVLVRPDWISRDGPLSGVVTDVFFRGSHTDYQVITPIGDMTVRREGAPSLQVGERCGWAVDRAWIPSSPG